MSLPPVAYIVFNRPQHTQKTFAVLRELQVPVLFLIADGPRSEHPDDQQRCARVREIVEQVDWPCEVHSNYADFNLGLKNRVSSGLDWVFEHVDRAIVLEDDCVAHPDFFSFCDQLLERYADDERVSVITGNNFQDGQHRGTGSYYFSKYNHCWGWATWRRAWDCYEGDLEFWPSWKQSDAWKTIAPNVIERHYWEDIFEKTLAGQYDSWAYPWTASIWHCGGLTATPNVNLVSNIGFGRDSTHTSSSNNPLGALPTASIGELIHPTVVRRDEEADQYTFRHVFLGEKGYLPWSFLMRIKKVVGNFWRELRLWKT